MRHLDKLIFLTAMLTILTACNTGKRRFTYPTNKRSYKQFSSEKTINKCIAVAPFADRRGDKVINNVIPSAAIVLPLMPFIQRDSDRPENNSIKFKAVKFKHFRVRDDITDAVITSINNSNLVSEVVGKSSNKYSSAEYLLYGQINKLNYRSRFMLYGVTCAGSVILGAVGLPMYIHHAEIDIDLFLYDRAKGKNVWEYTIVEDGAKLQGYYYNIGRSIITPNPKMGEEYGEMLLQGMNKALIDLKEKVLLDNVMDNKNNVID